MAYISWIGLEIQDYSWVLLFLILLTNIAAIIWVRKEKKASKKKPLPIPHPNKEPEVAFPLLVAAGMFGIALIPMVVNRQLSTIGYNGDAVFSSLLAKYVQHHGTTPPPVSFAQPYTIQTWYLSTGYWLGFIFFQVLIDQFFQLEPYESFSLLTALFLTLIPLTCYFFCRCCLKLEKKLTYTILILLAFNSSLFWLHYDDFAANIVGISLVIVIINLLVLLIETYQLNTVLLAALTLSAFIFTYPWMIGYIFGPVVIYLLYLWYGNKKPLFPMIIPLAKVAIFTLCINPWVIIRLVRQLSWLIGLPKTYLGGNVTQYISLSELYGLSHHRLVYEGWFLSPYFQALVLSLFVIALGVSIYGLIKGFGKTQALLLSFALTSAINFFYLKFLADYPYGFFKNLSMSIPIAIILLGLGVSSLYGSIRKAFQHSFPGNRLPKILTGSVITFVVLYMLINIYTLTLLTKVTSKSLTLNLTALKDLSARVKLLNIPSPLYLKDAKETRMLWFTYFFPYQPIVLNNLSPLIYYEIYPWAKPQDFYQAGISQDYVIIARKNKGLPFWAEKVLYENPEYQLLKKKPEVLYHLDFNPGPLLLADHNKVEITLYPKKIQINSVIYPIPTSVSAKGQSLRIRLLSVGGTTYLWEQAGIKKEAILRKDIGEVKKKINHLPFHIEITNLSPQSLIIPWLEILSRDEEDLTPGSIMSYFSEPLLPNSDFFVLAGWYDLDLSEEGKKGRWTGANALSFFPNPHKKILLRIEGVVYHWAIEDGNPPQVEILINGVRRDKFTLNDQAFVRELVLDKYLLGSGPWCELAFAVSKTVVPAQYEPSSDQRELGVKITHISYMPYYNPQEKILPGSEFYLIRGWHELEFDQAKKQWYRWTKAKAVTLFPNPHKKSLLIVQAQLPYLGQKDFSQATVKISLNGEPLAKFLAQEKIFNKNLVLEKELLGINDWCELEVAVDKTIIPKKIEGREDHRELGIKITQLALYDYFTPPERVLPDPAAELYVIQGWHELEYNKVKKQWCRWTEASAIALFKNPSQEGILELAGRLPTDFLPSYPIVRVQLQGREIDRFVATSNKFYRQIPLTKEILGLSSWLEISFSTNQIFIPDTYYKSGDKRKLGICITRVMFRRSHLEQHRSREIIDLGKPEAHRCLIKGWSGDESKRDDRDFNHSNAKESLLRVELPKVSDYFMNLRMIPSRRLATNSSLEVNIYLNGQFLSRIELIKNHWLDYQIFIPYHYLSTLDTNIFRFVYKHLGTKKEKSRCPTVAIERIGFIRTGLQRILPNSNLYIGPGWYELEYQFGAMIYWRKADNGAQFWLKRPWEATYLRLEGELIGNIEKHPTELQILYQGKPLAHLIPKDNYFVGRIKVSPELFSGSTWLKMAIQQKGLPLSKTPGRPRFKIYDLRLEERVLPNSPAQIIKGWSYLEKAPYGKDYWRWTEDAAEVYLPASAENKYLEIMGEMLPLEAYPQSPLVRIKIGDKLVGSFTPLSLHFYWRYKAPQEPTTLSLQAEPAIMADSVYHNGDPRKVGLKIQAIKYLPLQDRLNTLKIDLGKKEARGYLLDGWSTEEQWDDQANFVWAGAKKSVLQFVLPKRADYFMNLRLRPFIFPNAPQQSIKIYLNNKFLAEILPSTKTEWQEYQVFIRAKDLAWIGANKLYLIHRYTQKPSQVQSGKDQRDLAVAYDYIAFVPAPSRPKPPLWYRIKHKFLYLWARYLGKDNASKGI
jgi:hypothetical protein